MALKSILSIRGSLFWRISALFLVTFTLLAIVFFVVILSITKRYTDETTQRLNANVASHMLKHVKPFDNGKVNEAALETIMQSMMAVNPGLEVYILNPQGLILSSVVLHNKVNLGRISVEPIKSFLNNPDHALVYGDDPRNPEKSKIFSAAPVYEAGKLCGYVYMVLVSKEHDTIASALQDSYLLKVGMQSFLVALFFALLIALFALWLLMKSLRNIITMVKEFSGGNLKSRIAIQTSGELADLSTEINLMADTIVENMEELKQKDKIKRDLTANISHDIRTPISIINGYAETLLIKYDDLDKSKQLQYLQTIIKNTDRLKLLVDDLFELSKLESKQIKPRIEPFSITHLVSDLTSKYELAAHENGVVLEMKPTSDNPIVYSDVTMIERVLQNLIDNAIAYSKKNKSVEVTLKNEKEKMIVSVSNYGPEIPKEDLLRIFDRYYRVQDKNQVKGTGLGLAIVKNISDLLDLSISAKSSNSITTFTFNLPMNISYSVSTPTT